MRTKLFILLTLVSTNCFAQFNYGETLSKLKDWELISDKNEKQEYVERIKSLTESENIFRFFDLNELHIVDVDQDGLKDILFSGEGGIDGGITEVYRSNGVSFECILSVIGKLCDVSTYQPGEKMVLRINNYACCGGFTNVFENYVLTLQGGKIKYSLQSKEEYVPEMVFPTVFFDRPIAFKIRNEEYKLRFSPVIDDTTEIVRPFDAYGNTIDVYSKNTIGYAIAERKDVTGRIWWFVKIDNNTSGVHRDWNAVGDNNKEPTYSLGWMSSRYLDLIK
ncbi:hypothetical protein [Prolixibacter denitrificans]|uniref:VCBS repeat-containing protein n=1 Tax=Prolixibacter denitrificans TaxID=1541063 RepID=A0A2P8CF98_9BACT|nr:hypothetical protein [Prolixibacter denitrificans]PSK83651.1 hypothetical protein CLV93_10366 [Prolixibacter denitrificans]GET23199.1 hypothetical protein JCM18694_34450 [Prolixibacter denitrificans]